MSRIVRIIVWAIILFAFYFFISTVVKSCGTDKNPTASLENDTEMVDGDFEDTGDEYFEDSEDEDEAFDNEDSSENVNEDDASNDDNSQSFEEPIASSAVSENPPSKKVEKKSEPESNYTSSPSSSSSGKYLVVTGSFLMESNANGMIKKLKKMGYSGAGLIIFEASQYHTVTSGRYASNSDARSVEKNLKAAGIDCYVHRVK